MENFCNAVENNARKETAVENNKVNWQNNIVLTAVHAVWNFRRAWKSNVLRLNSASSVTGCYQHTSYINISNVPLPWWTCDRSILVFLVQKSSEMKPHEAGFTSYWPSVTDIMLSSNTCACFYFLFKQSHVVISLLKDLTKSGNYREKWYMLISAMSKKIFSHKTKNGFGHGQATTSWLLEFSHWTSPSKET